MADNQDTKPQLTPEYSEFETRDAGYQKSVKVARTVESIRLGLTALALAAGITIVGVASDTLSVYNTTHLGHDFLLDLWPAEFDLRPTIALVACGAVVLLVSAVSLLFSKLPPVSPRLYHLPHCGADKTSRFAATISYITGSLSSHPPSASSRVSSACRSSTALTLRALRSLYKHGPVNGLPSI